MQNIKPTNKVGAGVAVGALVTVVAWALRDFAGVDLPHETVGAFQVLAVFGAQWWVTDK